MNYSKLKDIIAQHNYSIAKASISIGRTEAWFHKAIKNESMTIADLEKLLKLCKMSLAEFFVNQSVLSAGNEGSEYDSEILKENNELLRENRLLRIKIEELENKTAGKLAIAKTSK